MVPTVVVAGPLYATDSLVRALAVAGRPHPIHAVVLRRPRVTVRGSLAVLQADPVFVVQNLALHRIAHVVRSEFSIHLDLKLTVDVNARKKAALVARVALALRHDRLAAQEEPNIARRVSGIAVVDPRDVLRSQAVDG